MDGAADASILIVEADAQGPILTCTEGLSLWGGVDPETGTIIDAHHDQHGASLAGQIVLMPTSRGSCSGSSILLELALNGHAPKALIFSQKDHVLTLGAIVATTMFDRPIAVARLQQSDYDALAKAPHAHLRDDRIKVDDHVISLGRQATNLALSASDEAMLSGAKGAALKHAMAAICAIAKVEGATDLVDVTRAHIDACIYASSAHMTFAETMRDMGAQIAIPSTTNAISVDHGAWRAQGVPKLFGDPAQRLADLYVEMGARPTFTCSPYLSPEAPAEDELIGWSESNAVIFANSVLGARTAKHPDFMDLFIAMTGRAPRSGVYLDENRAPQIIVEVDLPDGYDDALWPMLGWLTGHAAPDRIPVLRGLEAAAPTRDNLKALCASFGTTSGAPMLHVAGVTPEAHLPPTEDAPTVRLTKSDLAHAWQDFNSGPPTVDLIAFGSPHFSLTETRGLCDEMEAQECRAKIPVIVTLGRDVFADAQNEGLVAKLEARGVQFVRDICWCSITEPVFPPEARTLMTNSGKYAHYAPGLSGRAVRFGSIADCVRTAQTGTAGDTPPDWLA